MLSLPPVSISFPTSTSIEADQIEAPLKEGLTEAEALLKLGLTEKAQDGFSTLSTEERVNVLRLIGTNPKPDDAIGRLSSVVSHLTPGWIDKESILEHPKVDADGKAFKFPVINKMALFVRDCYQDIYNIIANSPTTLSHPRILLTGTPGIGKSTFLIYFIIRHLYKPIKSSGCR